MAKKIIQAVGQGPSRCWKAAFPSIIEAIRPMKDGVITGLNVTEQMLKRFIRMVHPRNMLAPAAHHRLRAVQLDPGRAAPAIRSRRWAPRLPSTRSKSP